VGKSGMGGKNDQLRGHAKFEKESGIFSVFSEMHVHDGRVDGYVKPLFSDLKVYDKDKDAEKTFGTKVKKKEVDIAAKMLKNRHRKDVATNLDISCPLQTPQTSVLQALVGLVQNAFIKAILPGFEREAAQSPGERKP